MATNKYFTQYSSINEQKLFDDLVVETVKIHGVDTYYVARTVQNEDDTLNESTLSIFDRAFLTEIYIESFQSFQGDGDFLSKFIGNQINDQMVVTIPITTFQNNITSKDETLIRPREGDLIFMPFNEKFFQINFVEHESVFYTTGMLHVYQLKCELINFSNEEFRTGISNIDKYTENFESYNVDDLETLHEHDYAAKNNFFEFENEKIIDDSEFDPLKDILITSVKDKP